MRAVFQHDPSGSKDEGVWRQDSKVGAAHVASSGSQLAVTDPCLCVAWRVNRGYGYIPGK